MIRKRRLGKKKQTGGSVRPLGVGNASGRVAFNPNGINIRPLDFNPLIAGIRERNNNFFRTTQSVQNALTSRRDFKEAQFQDRRDFIKDMYDEAFPSTAAGGTGGSTSDTYGLNASDPNQAPYIDMLNREIEGQRNKLLQAGISGKIDPTQFEDINRGTMKLLSAPEIVMYQKRNQMIEDMRTNMDIATNKKGVYGNFASFQQFEDAKVAFDSANSDAERLRLFGELNSAYNNHQLKPNITSEERDKMMAEINNYAQNPDKLWDRILEKGGILKDRDTSIAGISEAITQLVATDPSYLGILKSDAAQRGVGLEEHIKDFVISRVNNAPINAKDSSTVTTGLVQESLDTTQADNDIRSAEEQAGIVNGTERNNIRTEQRQNRALDISQEELNLERDKFNAEENGGATLRTTEDGRPISIIGDSVDVFKKNLAVSDGVTNNVIRDLSKIKGPITEAQAEKIARDNGLINEDGPYTNSVLRLSQGISFGKVPTSLGSENVFKSSASVSDPGSFRHPITVNNESGGNFGIRSGIIDTEGNREESWGGYQFNLPNGVMGKFIDFAKESGYENLPTSLDPVELDRYFETEFSQNPDKFVRIQEEFVAAETEPKVIKSFENRFPKIELDNELVDLLVATQNQFGAGGFSSMIGNITQAKDKNDFVDKLNAERSDRIDNSNNVSKENKKAIKKRFEDEAGAVKNSSSPRSGNTTRKTETPSVIFELDKQEAKDFKLRKRNDGTNVLTYTTKEGVDKFIPVDDEEQHQELINYLGRREIGASGEEYIFDR